MVEESTIPLLNAQQLGMAHLARGALLMPEMSQAATRELALSLLRQQARQVNRMEKDNASGQVDDEGGSQGEAFFANSGRQHDKKPAEDAPESTQHAENPLVGNLLNVKV